MKWTDNNGQVVIYGEAGHAEVMGLVGQTRGEAILVRNEEDLDKVDYSRPIYFFSQTTKSTRGFDKMRSLLEERSRKAQEEEAKDEFLNSNDTVCRQVSNSEPQLKKFSAAHDVILFVSGKKSSNGKVLFEVCKSVNPRTFFISDVDELDPSWLVDASSVGICGATSTPMWLMKKVEDHLLQAVPD